MKQLMYAASGRETLSSGFRTRSDTNRTVQIQKIVKDLKYRIQEVEGLYHLCRENKGTGQL